MASTPRIAVVIPTHRRETRLAFALDALAEQTLEPADFEVVVVRDHDASGQAAPPPDGVAVRELTCTQPGVATKRNEGWRAARAPLVAFLDDDCRPAPGWLENLVAAAAGSDAAKVIQGRTEPDPDELHLLYGLARSVRIEAPTPWYETCNIAYPRALLEALGGFDESFGFPPWGEDTDLGLRARRAGATIEFSSEALVWHAVHARRWVDAVREANRRVHTPRILARYPSYRRFLVAGIFANRAHAGIACGVAGLLAAWRPSGTRWAVAAVAVTPYLQAALREFAGSAPLTPRGLARLGLHLPLQASVDLVETAATVRGAIHHRTPVI